VQPSLRGRVRVGAGSLWSAVSHAVRRPTRFDADIRVTAPNGLLLIRGNPAFESESLMAYEGGYRVQPASFVAVDVALFTHRLDRLRSQDSPVVGLIPALIGNTLDGSSSGLEVGVDVQPVPRWRTHIGYTHLRTSIRRDGDSRDTTGGVSEANDPSHIFGARTSLDLPGNVEADAFLRAIGSLPNPQVPAYTEINLRVAWRPRQHLELALVGQDLLHAQHPEFGTAIPRREEFERSVRALLTLRIP
jgi:iron complex outermembrane recepter protein